jgi:hypothetical protein
MDSFSPTPALLIEYGTISVEQRVRLPRKISYKLIVTVYTSVADPDPDPSDPYVFGPPGSGSINQGYESASGS